MNIAEEIENYTAQNSRFELHRSYVSLSNIILTEDELIDQYHKGFTDSHRMRLKCYKGYQMEDDLKRRIKAVYADRINLHVEVKPEEFRGVIMGHPDFTLDGDPGDCKSVPLDEHLPKDGRVPRKVYAQMQGYMLYMKREKAVVIYESRETGIIRNYWLTANKAYQKEIDQKCYSIYNRFTALPE